MILMELTYTCILLRLPRILQAPTLKVKKEHKIAKTRDVEKEHMGEPHLYFQHQIFSKRLESSG